MAPIVKVILVLLIITGLAWGAVVLMGSPNQPVAAPEVAVYETSEASRERLEKAKPEWAELTDESRLHESGFPTPVRDPRTSIEYVLLPSGEFQFGRGDGAGYRDERDATAVVLAQPLYLARHEITVGQYRRFLEQGKTGLQIPFREEEKVPDDRPMVRVTHEEAEGFAQWAGGRLPTEAEYEFAAKGVSTRLRWPWGGEATAGDANIGIDMDQIWFEATAENYLAMVLKPAGASARDESWCGARGLAGNVAEWILDDWVSSPYFGMRSFDSEEPDANPEPLQDPRYERKRGYLKSVRGGSFAASLGAARCTNRSFFRPDGRLDSLGFRIARRP